MIFEHYIFHSDNTDKWTTNTDSEWETPPTTPKTSLGLPPSYTPPGSPDLAYLKNNGMILRFLSR